MSERTIDQRINDFMHGMNSGIVTCLVSFEASSEELAAATAAEITGAIRRDPLALEGIAELLEHGCEGRMAVHLDDWAGGGDDASR